MGEIERMGVLAKLLGNAVNYIKTTLVDRCPVCGAGISPQEVLGRLEKEMQRVGVEAVKSLQEEKRKLGVDLKKIENNLNMLKSLEEKLDGRRKREKGLEEIVKGLPLAELNKKVGELRGKLGKLLDQEAELNEKLEELIISFYVCWVPRMSLFM